MINTLKIYEELSQTLDQASAHKLASILGLFYDDLQNTATKTDFRVLDDSVRGLTETGKRTNERLDQLTAGLERLAEAQARTEQNVGQLALAQQRTEQRLDALAVQVGELAAAQQRTEQRLDALAVQVGELAAAQQRTEQRLDALAVQVGELAAAQQRTEQRLNELAAAQQRTEQRLDALAVQVGELAAAQQRTEQRLSELTGQIGQLTGVIQRHHDRLGRLDGRYLEIEVREKAHAYFGGLLKRTRVVPVNHLEEKLEAVLSEAELADLYRLDLLVQGRARHLPAAPEILVAIEVSVTLDSDDLDRAAARASVLRKAGLAAVAAVAGEKADPAVLELAGARGVAVFCNGHHYHWDTALARSLNAGRDS